MIKPSDKVLIGWLTLLATFASANLGRASASAMGITEQSANDNVADSAATEQADVTELTYTAIEINVQGIVPDTALKQPEFSPQPIPEEVQIEVTEPESEMAPTASESVANFPTDTRVAKLDHLVSTATQRSSDTESVEWSDDRIAKLKHLVATATRELPSTSSIAHMTAEALPSTRVVITPHSPVAEVVAEPNASIDTDSSTTVSGDKVVVTAATQSAIPDEAVPTSVVYTPISRDNAMPEAVAEQASAKQELSDTDTSNLAQTPVPDSSGSVGDSFSPEDLTDEELRQLLSVDAPFFPPPIPAPASSFGTPTAYGADEGDAFIGIAGVSDGDRSDTDGSLSLGAGIGDAVSAVGLEVNVGIISLDGFADDGQIGFKLHKIIPEADNLAIAVGWSNPITWGSADDAEETIYGVVTQRFDLQPNNSNPLPLTVSAGVGTGSFRSKGAIAAGDNPPNFFGSVGLRVIPEMSVVSSWTGSALNLGVSAAPFDFPLVFSAGASDVTDNTREGTRFSASMGYGFKF